MSTSKRLRLRLKHRYSNVFRSCLVLKKVANSFYTVRWQTSQEHEFQEYATQILAEVWVPLQMDYYDGAARISLSLIGRDMKRAWESIDRNLTRMNGGTVEEFSARSTGKKNTTPSYRRSWWTKSCRVFNDIGEEIVNKHYSSCKAVVVYPNSWIDNKIQEAYNKSSGEGKDKASK